MTNLGSIFKSGDITLPAKVCLVNAMLFPVVMYGCESCPVKKAEHWKICAFNLWCWRRLLRVPWTVRRSNQSILKEISPGISLEGMMLKLKLQHFGHLMQRVDSLEKTDAGRVWGQEEKGTTEDEIARWHHRLDGREFEWTSGVGDGQRGLVCFNSCGRKASVTPEWLNWTDMYLYRKCLFPTFLSPQLPVTPGNWVLYYWGKSLADSQKLSPEPIGQLETNLSVLTFSGKSLYLS